MIEPIRILIVDDHTVVRKGLRALLQTKSGFHVVAEAANGTEAVKRAAGHRPDVILLDLVMPGGGGIPAIKELTRQNPDTRILVLTSFAEDEKVFAAIKSGALGYLLKDSSPQELLEAIRAVHRGESFLHPSIAAKLVRELSEPWAEAVPADDSLVLTERETAVLKLVARGLTNQEIAEKLTISERTVTTHVSNILTKLHLANRTQATLYALREGLASLDDGPAAVTVH